MLTQFLQSLIKVSEKAANISRICRENNHLFALLIEEKKPDEANPRFVKDFKTLADVLIQETIKNDIGKLFPAIKEKIKGEESSQFTNILGETITVQIFENLDETAERLCNVLNGNDECGRILAEEVHRDIVLDNTDELPKDEISLDFNDLGIWIDPIDGTNEYIKGESKNSVHPKIPASGLQCVTILIGVYEISTGNPIIGIINQPFLNEKNEEGKTGYEGKIFWGISIGSTKLNNITQNPRNPRRKYAITSPSENRNYITLLKNMLGFDIVFSAGAGHKLLKLITGDCQLYYLSKGTTYKWDTCACQAILYSFNGHLLDLEQSLKLKREVEISYKETDGTCNRGGVIGYINGDYGEIIENYLRLA